MQRQNDHTIKAKRNIHVSNIKIRATQLGSPQETISIHKYYQTSQKSMYILGANTMSWKVKINVPEFLYTINDFQ